jgi:hypothetical protein
VIALPFDLGTRTTSVVPLSDTASGATLVDAQGMAVTLTLRWPDDPAIARERFTFLAAQQALTDAISAARTELDPARVGELMAQREDAMRGYAACLVIGWSVPAECTPDAVLALFARAPFALDVIVEAGGEQDRFLPESLRASRSASAPSSSAAAG